MDSAIIVTTINRPSRGVRAIAERHRDWELIVIGDRKTPADWHLDGSTFLSIDDQRAFHAALAEAIPVDHYSRKNLGYLWAMASGAQRIAETDDDNIPKPDFLQGASNPLRAAIVEDEGWVNVYRLFSDEVIWPRGFPLAEIRSSLDMTYRVSNLLEVDCPVQQFLADGDPDVDAIFRLLHGPGTQFGRGDFALGPGTFCPFNSQNTVWWPAAYALLYLPSFVSFRMTDIWRSFIAQACLHAAGQLVGFRSATVHQDRNEHSLIDDFRDEIPGYLDNERIIEIVGNLDLMPDATASGENLRKCYEALVGESIIPEEEIALVDLWLQAVAEMRRPDAFVR